MYNWGDTYFMNGIHAKPRPTRMIVEPRPKVTSSASVARGLSFRYTSHVSRVEHELNADARELMSAASMPGSTSPLKPAGSSRVTSAGYAESPAPERTSLYRAAATMPGSTKMNTGSTLR